MHCLHVQNVLEAVDAAGITRRDDTYREQAAVVGTAAAAAAAGAHMLLKAGQDPAAEHREAGADCNLKYLHPPVITHHDDTGIRIVVHRVRLHVCYVRLHVCYMHNAPMLRFRIAPVDQYGHDISHSNNTHPHCLDKESGFGAAAAAAEVAAARGAPLGTSS